MKTRTVDTIEGGPADQMTGSDRVRLVKILVSFVIISVIALQGIETFRLVCPDVCAPALWPFLDYPMYRDPHFAGDTFHDYEVIGVLPDGSEVLITAEQLGFDSNFKFMWLTSALLTGDSQSIEGIIWFYEERSGKMLQEIRIFDQPYVVQKDGAYPLEPLFVVSYNLGSGGE